MKKVLVTGASGRIGSLVIKYLLSEGKYEITALDLKSHNSQVLQKKYKNRINFVIGDVCDSDLIDDLIKKNDYVIHLAGVMPPLANVNTKLTHLIDYKGTENIVKAIEFYNKKCELIYASSTTIYDKSLSEVSISSKQQLDDIDYYSSSKIECEKLITSRLKKYVIFRLPLVLGDVFTSNILYMGNKNDYVELITEDDAAYAFVCALNNIDKIIGKKYNVSGGENCRILYKDLLNNILKTSGISLNYFKTRLLYRNNIKGYVYKDSDDLDNLIHFRTSSLNNYFNKQKKLHKNNVFRITLAKIFISKENK